MCFFKAKMPTQVTPSLPTVKETTAPEPQAPIFGGGVEAIAKDSQATKGVKGLKVTPLEKPAGLASSTGTAQGGLNVLR